MQTLLLLLAPPVLVAVATFLVVWGGLGEVGGYRLRPLDRLPPDPTSRRRPPQVGRMRGFFVSSLARVTQTGQFRESLERLLQGAGSALSAARLVTLTAGMSGGGALWMFIIARGAGLSPALATVMIAATGVFGAVIPYAWLHGRHQRRLRRIQHELPDHLDLLVVSIEAGLTFDAALSRIVDHAQGELTVEFRRVLTELELGVGRRSALQGLAARAGTPGVTSLVAAVMQAERTGMEIGPILRSQAERLRLQRRQRAAEAAMKAPVKMLFPLILFIFPSVFVVLLGPAMLTLVRTFGQR